MGAQHEKRKIKGTFIVNVMFRENATWQGEVVCADEKKKQYFRSALELIKMIDGALNSEEEKMQTKTETEED